MYIVVGKTVKNVHWMMRFLVIGVSLLQFSISSSSIINVRLLPTIDSLEASSRNFVRDVQRSIANLTNSVIDNPLVNFKFYHQGNGSKYTLDPSINKCSSPCHILLDDFVSQEADIGNKNLAVYIGETGTCLILNANIFIHSFL